MTGPFSASNTTVLASQLKSVQSSASKWTTRWKVRDLPHCILKSVRLHAQQFQNSSRDSSSAAACIANREIYVFRGPEGSSSIYGAKLTWLTLANLAGFENVFDASSVFSVQLEITFRL